MKPHVLRSSDEAGWIEVVCGSMFSGKTEELIRRLRRAKIAGQHVESFAPTLDTRSGPEEVVSHDETAHDSTSVDAAAQVLLMASGADVVGIDEAQFFGPGLVEVSQELARSGTRVVVAGLDQDFRGRPFEPIPQLMAVGEYVTKLHAICVECGAPANHSQRLTGETGQVLVGAGEAYEPRCRRCFDPPADEPAGSDASAEGNAPAKGDAATDAPSERPPAGAGGSEEERSKRETDATKAPAPAGTANSSEEAPF
jgi:thymidine kinase